MLLTETVNCLRLYGNYFGKLALFIKNLRGCKNLHCVVRGSQSVNSVGDVSFVFQAADFKAIAARYRDPDPTLGL